MVWAAWRQWSRRVEEDTTQWRGKFDRARHREYLQSARLSLQCSELAPPRPLTRKRVLPPLVPRWRWTHPQASVSPAPFGTKVEVDTLACGRGGGVGPIRMKGQTLWYSRYSIFPLRGKALEFCQRIWNGRKTVDLLATFHQWFYQMCSLEI